MDKQEAELRAELQGSGVSVTRNGDNITLNMPGNVTFASNSADLSPAFFDVLGSVGKVLGEFDQTVVEVAGHTDSTGEDEYNLQLSGRRAETVAEFLIGQAIEADRVIVLKFGERQPIADTATPEGRPQNPRVAMTLVTSTAR